MCCCLTCPLHSQTGNKSDVCILHTAQHWPDAARAIASRGAKTVIQHWYDISTEVVPSSLASKKKIVFLHGLGSDLMQTFEASNDFEKQPQLTENHVSAHLLKMVVIRIVFDGTENWKSKGDEHGSCSVFHQAVGYLPPTKRFLQIDATAG
jgi:hypothetical protein